MRIAIIGCGMIADTHVNEIKKIKNTEIVGVCDREPLMAAQLADRHDIPNHFHDVENMMKRCRSDVVHILTPPHTHLELGLLAMGVGCHVLMEKPFALNAQEANRLIGKAKSLKKKIVVNHFHNFSPPALRLKDMVTRGLIGDILHLDGFYSYSTESPVAMALINDKNAWLHRLPGKLFQNNIDHLIGKFVEFIPDLQPKVWACAQLIGKKLLNKPHSYIQDELRVLITGKSTTAHATFSSNIQPFQQSMTVYGTKRTVFIDYESRAFISLPQSNLPGPFGKLVTPFIAGKRFLYEGFKNMIDFMKNDYHFYAGANYLFRAFYKSIENDIEPPIKDTDILKTSWIMDEIFNQINDPIDIKLAV